MVFNRKNIQSELDNLKNGSSQKHIRRLMIVFRIFLSAFIICIITGIILSAAFVRSAISNAPSINDISAQPSGYSSKIYDSAGNIMQTLVMEGSNREEIAYSQMPSYLTQAFIAIEDSRFWEHNGVDAKGIIRAAFSNLSKGRISEGASTITQQLIKNNVLGGGGEADVLDKISRKIQEQYLALELEKKTSKETILEYYLNTINLGSNCLGVGVASQKYFGKKVSDLTLSECTVLAAITSNPTRYNPLTHPENNEKRRSIVLNAMYEQGMIDKDEMDTALNDDVYSRIQSANASQDSSNMIFSYFTDAVYNEVCEDLQSKLGYTSSQAYHLLYSGGLQIYSTMDARIQEIVDEEVNDPHNYYSSSGEYLKSYSMNYSLTVKHKNGTTSAYNEKDILNYNQTVLNKPAFKNIYDSLEELNSAVTRFKNYILNEGDTIEAEVLLPIIQPQASVVVMNQYTNEVVAISGGRGEKSGSLTLNRATDSARQPGSCFKILGVYAPALDCCGATLATTFYDSAYSIDGQTISNWWGSQYLGYNNIRQGITYSMNVLAVKCLMNLVTPAVGADYIKSFGITTLEDTDEVPSLALGGITNGVYNEELTAAYAAIADDGLYGKPVYYSKVLDRHGNVILENVPDKTRILKSSTAALLTDAMKDVISSDSTLYYQYGISPTGQLCKVDSMTLAGKSGSTSNGNDLWFVGYSPYYTCGVWSGYDESKSLGLGTEYDKTMWQKIMARIHEGLEDKDFTFTDTLQTAAICSKSGLLSIDGVCNNCENTDVYIEKFAKGTVPTDYCSRHYTLWICNASGKLATEYCPKDEVSQNVFLKIDDADLLSGTTLDSSLLAPSNMQSCDVHHAQ